MSKISIDLIWDLDKGEMSPGKYSNQHEIIFTPNMKIIADSAPDWRGSELNSNPEQTLAVFVQPPSLEELEKRLRDRATENEEKIQQRLDKSAMELTFSPDFDVILINDNLNQVKQEVVRLVKQFLHS